MNLAFDQVSNHPAAVGYALSLFIGTFILEDVAALAAGLLLASGSISWPAAFMACFLGIWSGDAGLYALARCGGRRWFERSRFQRYSNRVTQSETWFAKRGTSLLIFSRMLPGARLPTYLAAGFLRLPLGRFLLVTGTASLVWTVLLLAISQAAGSRVLQWLGVAKYGGWAVLGILVSAWGAVWLGRKTFARDFHRRVSIFSGRLVRWEFWPPWMFYPPVVVYCLWLVLKYRSIRAPLTSNPGILTGGLVGESKLATLKDLSRTSPDFTAEAELLTGKTFEEKIRSLEEICDRLNISVPFILKPDVGQRGVGVKLIRHFSQAEAYLQQVSGNIIVQRYAPGPHEVGVFYYRFPHQPTGHIFAITEKVFPRIVGDGVASIFELIWQDPRARFMAAKYLTRFKGRENEILPAGEKLKLVEAGDHAQGCIFQDGMHLLTPALAQRVDEISQKLDGFYVGRYDIRYSSLDDLQRGQNFQIVELNGAASEATSLYDARNSLFAAYRTLFRQWDLVFAIGAANRDHGATAAPVRLLWQKWREYNQLARTYPIAD